MKRIILILFVSLFANYAIAGTNQTNFNQNPNIGSVDTVKTGKSFDGVWKGQGNVTLIKQLKRYVILQGKDAQSTWSAKGVIKGKQLICRGNGVTNGGNQFVYESTMTLKNGILIDQWKAIFSTEKTLEGKDELKLLDAGGKVIKKERVR